ncbi:MAG: hypothetical protein U0326_07980 [Polyangiales bacterium]
MTSPTASVRDAQWIETQFTRRARRLDRALRVEVDGRPEVHHVEWAWRWSRRIPYRMFEYHAMLAMALHEEDAQRAVPIRSTVVLLSGRERPWPAACEYRTSAEGAPFAGVRVRVDAVYQQSIEALRARGSELWLAFAPLALDADERGVRRVAGELCERVRDEGELAELAAAMAVFAEVDGRRRGLGPRVEAMFPNEVIMRNSIYTRGRDEGIALGRDEGIALGRDEGIALGRDEGIAPLLRVVSRRLGRDLRPEERSALARHIETPEGAARLGDLVIDLSPADLAAWLADPDA